MATDPRTVRQFARFLAVGAFNTLVGYGIFASLVLLGMHPVPALVINYVVGTLINYVTTGRFVFGTRDASGLARFIGAYVVIYFFNWGMFHAVSQAVPQPLLAQALCIPVVAVFSFVLFKRFVFKR